ncbi:hypothetical protein QYM36_017435 [Artemia franciscana]|uniref:Lariat debranching enzyme C-terminal domain-containing protein n=1 Tax=Artemia franciscana TaxID=6661 RepID=A0AA88L2I8_ARTSF|nr:hypothetical protein QYM36_017435 [Artemia franciscana]
MLTGKIDILITHDWPRGIYNYGDKNTLLRYKEFFREEVEQNTLGSRAGELLLEDVRPAHWFAAHLHVRFTATVNHEEKDGKPASVTRFLALDKCLPKRKFLEIIDFPDGNSNKNYLDYDEEWLAILKSTNHLLSVVNSTQHMPGPGYSGRWDFRPTKEELAKVKSAFNPDLRIPENFIRTAPVFNGRHRFDGVVPDPLKNPQTESFCDKLGVDDPVEVILSSRAPAKKRVDVSVVEESELDVTLSGTNEKTDISISTDSEDTGSPGLFFVDKQGSTPSSTLNSTPRLPSFSRSTPNFNRSGNAFSPSSPFQSPPLTQRFRMTLPSPKQDKQEEAVVSRGTLGPKIYPSSPLAIRYPAESPKRECNSDVGPRQFKRRNASLYDASE